MRMFATQIGDWYAAPTSFGFRCRSGLWIFDPIQKLSMLRIAEVDFAGACHTHRQCRNGTTGDL